MQLCSRSATARQSARGLEGRQQLASACTPAHACHAHTHAYHTHPPAPASLLQWRGSGRRSSSSSTARRTVRASAAEVLDAPIEEPASVQGEDTFKLVCPICQTQHFSLPGMPASAEGLSCSRCRRTFDSKPTYVDLTLTSGLKPKAYARKEWGGTELFRSPLISFVYERGWRQGFAWAGFPGVEKEYEMAMGYLEPVAKGKVIVDMSCGSGLFSKRFARSGKFSGVVAADFSENMLLQAGTFFKEDGTMPRTPRPTASSPAQSGSGTATFRPASTSDGGAANPAPILLLRADVARLPFATGSVAALHAGAAIHCWPNPQAAMAEISRVLAPGGVFVATTFLVPSAPLGSVLGDDVVRPLNQLDSASIQGNYRWWEEAELRDLCTSVGLQDFQRDRQWRFIMFSARKPF